MRFKLLLLCFIVFLGVSSCHAITVKETDPEIVDSVFPELIYNTDDCLIDCSAQFKYCLDADGEYELKFNVPAVISYGYYKNESYTETDYSKCINEETLTYECPDEEKNETGCEDYNYTNCIEYGTKEVIRAVWHEGLPSEKSGCYEVTIYGKKKPFENVDWKPTLVKKGFLWDTEYTQEKWAWWNSSWTYKKEISVKSPSESDVINITIPIHVNTQELISSGKLQSDCDDLRFVENTETSELNWYFENENDDTYGCNKEDSVIFIRIPSLNADNSTKIIMYYSNDGATQSTFENSKNTYDKYTVEVFNNNLTTGIFGTILNKTAGATSEHNGIVGKNRYYGGSAYTGDNTTIEQRLNGVTEYTVSFWVNKTADSGNSEVYFVSDMWSGTAQDNLRIGTRNNGVLLYSAHSTGGKGICSVGTDLYTGFTPKEDGSENNHISATINTTGVYLFLNGTLINSTSCSETGSYDGTYTTYFYNIGRLSNPAWGIPLSGSMDEIRIYNTSRSSSWVKADYQISKFPDSYIIFGEEESLGFILFSTQNPANNSIINNTHTINFNVTPSGNFETMSCNLSINGTLNQTNWTVYNNTLTNFEVNGLPYGYWNWTITCWNGTTTNSSTYFLGMFNSAPSMQEVILNSTTNATSSNITGWCRASDAENIVYYYKLWKNNVVYSTGLSSGNESYCYQEFANVSTSCGGLNTGSYSKGGGWLNSQNTIDGNLSTYGEGFTRGYIDVTYERPMLSNPSSTLFVKIGSLSTMDETNLTIDSTCWLPQLKFRLYSDNSGGFGSSWNVSCWNTTDWVLLLYNSDPSGAALLFEEAMWWNISSGYVQNTTELLTSIMPTAGIWKLSCISSDGFLNSSEANSTELNITSDDDIIISNITFNAVNPVEIGSSLEYVRANITSLSGNVSDALITIIKPDGNTAVSNASMYLESGSNNSAIWRYNSTLLLNQTWWRYGSGYNITIYANGTSGSFGSNTSFINVTDTVPPIISNEKQEYCLPVNASTEFWYTLTEINVNSTYILFTHANGTTYDVCNSTRNGTIICTFGNSAQTSIVADNYTALFWARDEGGNVVSTLKTFRVVESCSEFESSGGGTNMPARTNSSHDYIEVIHNYPKPKTVLDVMTEFLSSPLPIQPLDKFTLCWWHAAVTGVITLSMVAKIRRIKKSKDDIKIKYKRI